MQSASFRRKAAAPVRTLFGAPSLLSEREREAGTGALAQASTPKLETCVENRPAGKLLRGTTRCAGLARPARDSPYVIVSPSRR